MVVEENKSGPTLVGRYPGCPYFLGPVTPPRVGCCAAVIEVFVFSLPLGFPFGATIACVRTVVRKLGARVMVTTENDDPSSYYR